jgi:hypothetical protein
MLCVNESGELHAKLADLGSAVLLPSAAALRTDATGTSGYAGELVSCFFLFVLIKSTQITY